MYTFNHVVAIHNKTFLYLISYINFHPSTTSWSITIVSIIQMVKL